MANGGDVFTQRGVIPLVESAANTLTFSRVESGASLFERRAMVVHRLDAYIGTTRSLFVDEADALLFGLATANVAADVDYADPNMAIIGLLGNTSIGAATYGWPYSDPVSQDFSELPGGGIIVPLFPLYGFVLGVSLASAAAITLRFHYTIKQLKPEEYIELVESTRILT